MTKFADMKPSVEILPKDWELWITRPVHSMSIYHRGRWENGVLKCWDCPAEYTPPKREASLLVQPRPMLVGDLQSWDLDENMEIVDHAEYVKWADATRNWSFGDDRGAE